MADKKVRSSNMVAGKERRDGLKSIHEDQWGGVLAMLLDRLDTGMQWREGKNFTSLVRGDDSANQTT